MSFEKFALSNLDNDLKFNSSASFLFFDINIVQKISIYQFLYQGGILHGLAELRLSET